MQTFESLYHFFGAMMPQIYSQELLKGVDLDSLDVNNICKEWPVIRPILVVAQSVLSVLFPPGAAAIGAIIAVFDKLCPRH